MSNRTVPATAEGMPSLTRRLFLRGAAVVAPMIAIPAAAAVASNYVEENATLLALEPELDIAITEVESANAAYNKARRDGTKLWPRAPEAITLPYYDGESLERDITGRGYEPTVCVRSLFSLQNNLRSQMRRRKKTMEVEEARRRARELVEIAERYEAQREDAKTAVGYDEADARKATAHKAMMSIVGRVQAEPCRTMAGIRLKAKALQAFHEHADHWERIANLEGRDRWMPDFCQSLVGVLES